MNVLVNPSTLTVKVNLYMMFRYIGENHGTRFIKTSYWVKRVIVVE